MAGSGRPGLLVHAWVPAEPRTGSRGGRPGRAAGSVARDVSSATGSAESPTPRLAASHCDTRPLCVWERMPEAPKHRPGLVPAQSPDMAPEACRAGRIPGGGRRLTSARRRPRRSALRRRLLWDPGPPLQTDAPAPDPRPCRLGPGAPSRNPPSQGTCPDARGRPAVTVAAGLWPWPPGSDCAPCAVWSARLRLRNRAGKTTVRFQPRVYCPVVTSQGIHPASS